MLNFAPIVETNFFTLDSNRSIYWDFELADFVQRCFAPGPKIVQWDDFGLGRGHRCFFVRNSASIHLGRNGGFDLRWNMLFVQYRIQGTWCRRRWSTKHVCVVYEYFRRWRNRKLELSTDRATGAARKFGCFDGYTNHTQHFC